MIKPRNKISVAKYLTQQIAVSGKAQATISAEVGYDKPNNITMMKQGKTKIPINKIPAFAKSLGIDPLHLLRLAMSEYMPETWETIESVLNSNQVVSEHEMRIIKMIRDASGGLPVAPESDADRAELNALVTKWHNRAEKLTEASERRAEKEKSTARERE